MNKKFFLPSFVYFLFSLSFFSAQTVSEGNARTSVVQESVYSQNIPSLLQGIWQGNDRLILFSGEQSEFACVLRVFYQWYDDRAAEPERYAQLSSRNRNDTTAVNAENIEIKYRTIAENEKKSAGAYELQVKYPGQKELVYIPVAVLNKSIYLNFYLRSNCYEAYQLDENGSASQKLEEVISIKAPASTDKIEYRILPDKYYLGDTGAASGITISPPVIKKELLSYFVDGSSVYHLRYWLSDMDLTDEKAEFSDGENYYNVNKFIQTAGKLYTCTTGRSKKIRNIQKSNFLKIDFTTDEENLIYAYGKPYLILVPEEASQKQLQSDVDKNNVRRHPPVQPLFPVSDINFHWKEISDLEKYNPYSWNRRNLDLNK